MKESKTFLKKYKYILALVMAMIVTTALANSKENEKYDFLDNNASISNNSNKNDNIVNNLVLVRDKDEIYLLFCPKDRGLCVNYETEEFMFMYRNSDDLLNNLKEYFSIDIETEKFKPYLIEKYGYKESYSYNEIFTIFDSLKNNNKTYIKIK